MPPPSTASSSSSYHTSAPLLPPLAGPSGVVPLAGPSMGHVDQSQFANRSEMEQPQPPKPSGRLGVKRRQKYTRTRTGCLTCRARRIKCDGARPTCRKCNVAKREVSLSFLPYTPPMALCLLVDRLSPLNDHLRAPWSKISLCHCSAPVLIGSRLSEDRL